MRRTRLNTFALDTATIVARARGLFAAERIDIEVIIASSPSEQMRGLGSASWEIACTGFDNVLVWSGRDGAEIVAVAQADRGTVLPVYVRPEIRSWADLRGRSLAVDATDTGYALVLRRILLAHGLDMDRGDYELAPVGATQDRMDSMRRGETFAAILQPPLDEEAVAAGIVRLGDHREVLLNYPGGSLCREPGLGRCKPG